MHRPIITLTVIAAVASVSFAPAHAADPELEAATNQAADQALRQTEALATSISFAFDYLATFLGEAGPPAAVAHAELQATTARIDGARSILVIENDGKLAHDAFAYPPPAVNLANREYVQKALEHPGLQFSEPTVGRTSGIPFAPLSVYKPALHSVFAAIMDLRKLREPLNWCSSLCGGAILTAEGGLIAASPPEAVFPDEIIQTILAAEKNEGIFFLNLPQFEVLIAFRKSTRFPIIIVASRIVAPTSSVATE